MKIIVIVFIAFLLGYEVRRFFEFSLPDDPYSGVPERINDCARCEGKGWIATYGDSLICPECKGMARDGF